MAQKLKNNFGFTVIELMVVVVIIGVVAGAIVLRNQTAVDQGKLSKAKSFATSIPVTLAGNFVANWKFDQVNVPSSNLTPDSWGGNDGTLGYSGSYSVPSLQTSGCVFDNCLQFSSAANTGNYVSCSDNSELQLTKYYTIEFWIYRSSDIGLTERIISRTTNSTAGSYDLWVQILTTDQVQIGLIKSTSTGATLAGNTVIGLSQWYHVVASKDESNFYIYVNGTLDNSGVTSGLTMGDARVTVGNTLNMGRLGSGGTWYYGFNGKLDDVRIYNYTFKLGEVQNHYLVGIKNLLKNGQISPAEYASRITQLNQNIVKK